jgi:hypothetical protein
LGSLYLPFVFSVWGRVSLLFLSPPSVFNQLGVFKLK